MKKVGIIILIAISYASSGQNLKEKLQGNWVCINILDSIGNPVSGKFGEPTEYLRFGFKGSMFSISESPFEQGIPIPVVFKNQNSFDLAPNAIIYIPERVYKIEALDLDTLLLSTKNEKGNTIVYHFINQDKFLSANNMVYDLGIIVIRHIQISEKDSNARNRSFEYLTTNDSAYLKSGPIYRGRSSFGSSFSWQFNFPDYFEFEEISEELVVEFEVSSKGANKFIVIKSLGKEFDDEVIRVLDKLKRAWRIGKKNDKKDIETARLHFYFYLSKSLLPHQK